MKQAFPPLVNQNSRILILGTMPGEKSLELQEYYGNKGNSFWKLLFTLFNRPLPKEYIEKKQLLEENNIALWDVLAYCERTGSLDSNIKNEKANDFESFYKQYPNIKHVFFSSKNASNFYDKYVGRKKDLQYSILPSPSGANASKSFLQKLEEWEAILEALK
ncbi:MAG: DNA-deoxyinosine glycosylase [Flavobacterium lindanitolerans]|jgi:hypoxanthine-DNA glycosylase|uniref:DNA-deoxyinosine glycosylase n=1 Tax=Flavobacterium lindanitolerans TaxID=428988 RepID=UPI000DB37C4F|nr:DNA-deoxyinosine glycosylase [Flavobacterium lindanitolerans]MBL7867356.1 DNA-deoxyinosine glycosylase [Flavobacterium lindanitolerans]PZO33004.1 MAG: DNA-deoxyinosine glycosylase [Flavobacteriaceae bacterium]